MQHFRQVLGTNSGREKCVWGRTRGKCVWGRTGVRAVLFALCLGTFTPIALAQSYSLAWDRNPDAFTVGYRVYGGSAPGQYAWSTDVGNATSAALPSLSQGASYYFVVRGYNAAGEIGPASAEVSLDLAAPRTPTGLTASAAGSRVTLSWAPAAGGAGVSQYLVSVGTSPGAADIANAVGVGPRTSASGDIGPGRYFARIQAANSFGVSAPSSDVSFIIGGPDQPASPSALSVTWQGTVATFQWNPGAAAAAYIVEAGSAPGTSNLGVLNVGLATRFSVDVPPGTYYVRVRAANSSGVSGPSNELLVRGPGAPSNPSGLAATVTSTTVTLRWTAPTGTSPTGYVLEVGSGPGRADLAAVQIGAVTTYAAAAPPRGTYYVRVRAVNARGASSPSNEVVVRR